MNPLRVLLLVRIFAGVATCMVGTPLLGQTEPVRSKASTRRLQDLAPVWREAAPAATSRALAANQQIVVQEKAAATGAPKARLVVTDLAGNAVAAETESGGGVIVTRTSAKWLLVRPETMTTLPMREGIQALPGVCLPPADTAGFSAGDDLKSYVSFSTVPVTWSTERDAYVVLGRVGVARNGDDRISGPLGTSAEVGVVVENVRDAVAEGCVLDRLGQEGEGGIVARFSATTSSAPTLVIRSKVAAEQRYRMEVQPRVVIDVQNNPILGLGLEKSIVRVFCVNADGTQLPVGSAAIVSVTCSGVRAKGTETLTLSDASPVGQFEISSMGLGAGKVRADVSAGGHAPVGSVTIRQLFPWSQVVAALLGGALGGFARRFMRGARKRKAAARVVEGIVVGLVAFVAGVLGVGFFGFPPAIVATGAGAFLTATIGGFAGVVLLERLANRTAATSG